ncbi:unnamed protein product, partial [Sphacelaria rigidula]
MHAHISSARRCNATVVAVRERAESPVVLGVGSMGGGANESGLDLLISYRVFDPDGDQEDLWEDNGIDQPDHPDYRAGGNLVTSEAQREDVRAIAAALAPGGLAGTPLPGPAPAAMPS